MGINVEFTPFELKALKDFMEDYVNKDNLSIYKEPTVQHLFLAFMKILKAREDWEEAMSYTE